MSSVVSPSTIFLGLDVHKESITIAVLPSDAKAPTRVDKLPHDLRKIRRYVERLGSAESIQACYEASGAGYVVHRAFVEWGMACAVIAPSLIPTKPGVQRKHDKYDASQLARLFRAGELTPVHVPTEAEERVRDLVRCRATFQREILKSRHYILKFLARRGFVFREGTNWRQPHYEWLRRLASAKSPLVAEDRIVFGEYLALLEYKLARREELDRQIEALALTPALASRIARLQCFRGIDVHAAMVLATELADWRRFGSARELMAFFGLVPREHSSGERQRRGSITKAGNSFVRHVLVQAGWSYRFAPKVGLALKKRQEGQDARVIAHAWKAQHRAHKVFRRLSATRPPQIAVVAVARELIGFLWSVMREVEPTTA
ncbi:MAG: IS110 family transposase [Gemmatimonas sp.]